MAIDYKIWNFPDIKISKQLFHVPGMAVEGGLTVGGARIMSPEPGGRAVLEIEPSLQVDEWTAPMSSWLMSKINGAIFRVRLAQTPQIASARLTGTYPTGVYWAAEGNFLAAPWDNGQPWQADSEADNLATLFTSPALEGTTVVRIDMALFGPILKQGHVIGHMDHCYMVDDISYANGEARVVITPPLCKDVLPGDLCEFRPWFLGSIINGEQIRMTYDAEQVGYIKPGKIIFGQVRL